MGEYGSPEGIPALEAQGATVIVVWNKADRVTDRAKHQPSRSGEICISAKTGEGMSDLEEALAEQVRMLALQSEAPLLTRARHREAVTVAVTRLGEALREPDPVLVAEHLRSSVAALGRIIGKVDVEELLDRIFRDFCIGK